MKITLVVTRVHFIQLSFHTPRLYSKINIVILATRFYLIIYVRTLTHGAAKARSRAFLFLSAAIVRCRSISASCSR